MIVTQDGCRSLTHGSSNQQLLKARQLSLRGADALERSREQDAELLFSQALQLSPMDERAHWGYSMTLWTRGDKTSAMEHMREAVRLSGRNPIYSIRLGEMCLDMGDRKGARQQALDVLSSNRNHAEAWALLGDTHRADHDWNNASECYLHALLIQSDFPKVQLALADIYRQTNKPKRALACLDHMADLHSNSCDDPEQLLVRGLVFAELNRPNEAAAALARCSDRLPVDRIDQQLQLVDAQQRLGELVAARISLGRMLTTHPNHPEVGRLKTQLDSQFAKMTDPGSQKLSPIPNYMLIDDALSSDPSSKINGSYIATPLLDSTRNLRR